MSARASSHLSIAAVVLFCVSCPLPVSAQQNPVQEAAQLAEQAAKLHRQGRYQDSIPLAERALAITETAFGPESPQTAAALVDLAVAC